MRLLVQTQGVPVRDDLLLGAVHVLRLVPALALAERLAGRAHAARARR